MYSDTAIARWQTVANLNLIESLFAGLKNREMLSSCSFLPRSYSLCSMAENNKKQYLDTAANKHRGFNRILYIQSPCSGLCLQ